MYAINLKKEWMNKSIRCGLSSSQNFGAIRTCCDRDGCYHNTFKSKDFDRGVCHAKI